MPPAVPCVSECSSLATGTPAFVVVGRCSAAVMTKSPRLLVTVLELGLGGDGGQLLDGDGQFRVLVRLDSVRLGGERSQQVPVAAHVVTAGLRRYSPRPAAGCPHARRGSGQLVQLVNIRAGPLPRVLPGGHKALVEQGQKGVVT